MSSSSTSTSTSTPSAQPPLSFPHLPAPHPTALAIVRSRAARAARDAWFVRAAAPAVAPAAAPAIAPAAAAASTKSGGSAAAAAPPIAGSGSGRAWVRACGDGVSGSADLMRGIGAWVEETERWVGRWMLEVEVVGAAWWSAEVQVEEEEAVQGQVEAQEEGYWSESSRRNEIEVAGVVLGAMEEVEDEGYESDSSEGGDAHDSLVKEGGEDDSPDSVKIDEDPGYLADLDAYTDSDESIPAWYHDEDCSYTYPGDVSLPLDDPER